jgi:type IV secretion system protein VirB4
MMNLAEYRHRSQSLADFLPWAALVEKGVILNKDGSFQRTARFRGPDLDSATPPRASWTPSAGRSLRKRVRISRAGIF